MLVIIQKQISNTIQITGVILSSADVRKSNIAYLLGPEAYLSTSD